MKKAATIVGSILILVISFTIGMMYFATGNTEIEKREQVITQNKKCRLYFTKMWDIMKDKAKVADEYKESFKEIFIPLIEGRYSKGDGALMKWITESNPNFDASMYKDLMKSIEIERTGFFNEQSLLADMQREHKTYILKAPNRWFLNDTLKPVEIKLIENLATKDSYDSGIEKEIDLFENQTDKK